jgi:hypothetical protein
MDDGKRTVLVAALSVYAELLAKNTAQLDLEQGKGKGKASDDDVDLKAEIQSQIKLCREIADATSGKDFARTFEVTCPEPWEEPKNVPEKRPHEDKSENENSWDDLSSQGFYAPTAAPASSQPAKRSLPKPRQEYIVQDEPFINLFTGFPVIPETGFEAGPSNAVPPPLRTVPRRPTVPSRRLSKRSGSSPGPAVRPPPKPQHLRARSLVPSQSPLNSSPTLPPQRLAPTPPTSRNSSLASSATLPPQRPAPPLPLFSTHELPEWQRTLKTSVPSQYGLTHTSYGVGGGPTTEEFWNESSPTNVQPPISSSPPYNWEADIQDAREEGHRNQNHDQVTKLSQVRSSICTYM